MIFDDLNDDNFLMYAMKEYNDIQCTDIEEFYDDLKKIKYIKRLFNIYKNDGQLNSEKEKAIHYYNNLITVWDKLNIPKNINQFGFTNDGIAKFVLDTLDLKNALDQNPVPFNKNDIFSTLNKLLSD